MALLKKRIHAGININDTSIELVVVQDSDHPAEITTQARVELPQGAIVRGSILNEEVLRRGLKELKRKARIDGDATIAATLSVSEYLVFPFSLNAEEIPQSDPASFIREEARRKIPLDQDDQEVFTLIHTTGARKRVFYVLNTHIIKYYQEILSKERIEIDHIEPESVAIARFLLPAFQSQQITYVCDIGKETSHILTLQFGIPILSQTIPIGSHTLTRGTEVDTERCEELKEEILKRIHTNKATIYLVGGGSLLPHLVDELTGTELDARVGVLGHPVQHPGLSDSRLRLYAHAIGSALRFASYAGGTALEPLRDTSHASGSRTTLAQFKSRTALLTAIFVVLLLVLIIVGILTGRKESNQLSPPTTETNQQETGTSLEVFTASLSDELFAGASFTEQTLSESTSVATTGSNDAGDATVSDADVDTARARLEGMLQRMLEEYFDAQTNQETFVVFIASETIFSLQTEPDIGVQSNQVTVRVTATGKAYTISREAITKAIQQRLGNSISIDTMHVSLPIFTAATSEGTLSIRATYTR